LFPKNIPAQTCKLFEWGTIHSTQEKMAQGPDLQQLDVNTGIATHKAG
jgi:hypothetical protein